MFAGAAALLVFALRRRHLAEVEQAVEAGETAAVPA